MAKCEKCGFDPDEPIGQALEDIPEGHQGLIALNQNGLLWMQHNGHLYREQASKHREEAGAMEFVRELLLKNGAPNNWEVMKN